MTSNGVCIVELTKLVRSKWADAAEIGLILLELAWELKHLNFSAVHHRQEIERKHIDNPLKNFGKTVRASRHWTSGRWPSQTNPEVQNAGLTLLKNVLFTVRTLNFSLFFQITWLLSGSAYDLQILSPTNKSLSFISRQHLLSFCA